MPIHFTKSVYEPAAPEDGLRLIVMRRYPRGYAKSRAHAWLPDLAPSLPLVHWYHGRLNAIRRKWEKKDPLRCEREVAAFWRKYSHRYLDEMQERRRWIDFMARLHRGFGMDLTLLCACPDHRICHRSLLAALIRAAAGAKARRA